MPELLTENEAQKLVEEYMKKESTATPTQEILDSGEVPRLKGCKVQPGKVSDSIYGGKGSFEEKKTGETVEFENPPLNTKNDVPLRNMVRTERISTHDKLRGEIPFKGQILAINHNYMRKLIAHAIGTSQFEVEGLGDNSVVLAAENLKTIMFENVLRLYMAKSTTSTSLYQAWLKGEKEFAGHKIPKGIIPNGALPYIMDTPSTKAESDKTVNPKYLFEKGVCTTRQYVEIRNNSILGVGIASGHLRKVGIILVDTKLEHGISIDGKIKSQDEIITMDSSRFWLLEDYEEQWEKLMRGEITELSPKSYSKEFARGYSKGDEGYTDDVRAKIAVRYIMGIQHLTGERFKPDMKPRDERVVEGLQTIVDELVA